MRKDLMRFQQMMAKIKNPLKKVEGEEKYAEGKKLGVKTDDLQSMPRSTRDIVYTARLNAARKDNENQ